MSPENVKSQESLKYLHFNNPDAVKNPRKYFEKVQSRTVAIKPLSPDEINAVVAVFLKSTGPVSVQLEIGVTLLGRGDNYNRKTGRQEAEKRMEHPLVEVSGVSITPTHIFVHLAPYKGLSLNLRLNRTSGFSTVTGELTALVPFAHF